MNKDLLKNRIGVNLKELYEDSDALIGLMRHSDETHNTFEYWLGYFMPENTTVPEGFGMKIPLK